VSEFHANGLRLFTPEEDQFLIRGYATMTAPAMAEHIGRPAGSVRSRIIHLRQQGRIFGKPYRAPKTFSGERVGVRTKEAIQAEHDAVCDEVRIYLESQVRYRTMTIDHALLLADRLKSHLATRGSARLVNMPVVSIVELLEAA
jgi:hypothetical protein